MHSETFEILNSGMISYKMVYIKLYFKNKEIKFCCLLIMDIARIIKRVVMFDEHGKGINNAISSERVINLRIINLGLNQK